MSDTRGFTIEISSTDRKIVDVAISSIHQSVVKVGAVVRGPMLKKNYTDKNGIVLHVRKLKVLEAVEGTVEALNQLDLPKNVNCKILNSIN